MANRKTTTTRHHAHPARRPSSARADAGDPGHGSVPDSLHDAIETERDNLSKAESLIGCLAIAMEHDDSREAPYYPDIARMARQMIKTSIDNLDSLTLRRHMSRNKVEENAMRSYGVRRCDTRRQDALPVSQTVN